MTRIEMFVSVLIFPDFKWVYFRFIYVHLTQAVSVSEDTGLGKEEESRRQHYYVKWFKENLKNPREREFSLSSLQNKVASYPDSQG